MDLLAWEDINRSVIVNEWVDQQKLFIGKFPKIKSSLYLHQRALGAFSIEYHFVSLHISQVESSEENVACI